jgi:hypothetical protein
MPTLDERVTKGSAVLLAMQQRGEDSTEKYRTYFEAWLDLVHQQELIEDETVMPLVEQVEKRNSLDVTVKAEGSAWRWSSGKWARQ